MKRNQVGRVSHRQRRWWRRLIEVDSDDEYNQFAVNLATRLPSWLSSSFGKPWLNAEFRRDGDADLIEMEIEMGRPLLVGWLHHGDVLLGEPRCNGMVAAIGALLAGMQERTAMILNGSCKIRVVCLTWLNWAQNRI